jgi:hypothetical protein
VELTAGVTLLITEDSWAVEPDTALGNAMLGGYMDAQRQMSLGQPAPAQAPSQEPEPSPETPQATEGEEAAPEENAPAEEERPEWASPDDVIVDGMVVPRE